MGRRFESCRERSETIHDKKLQYSKHRETVNSGVEFYGFIQAQIDNFLI